MTHLLIVLFIILTISAVTDLLYRKIPNAVTLSTIIFGLIFHSYLNGFDGFLFSAGGTFLGLGVLLFFYLAGMMGAGDVKLMAAVGSILGASGVFRAFLFSAVIGGIYAIIVLAAKGQLLPFLKRIALSLKLTVLTMRPQLVPGDSKVSPVLCYGLAIGVGTVLSVLL